MKRVPQMIYDTLRCSDEPMHRQDIFANVAACKDAVRKTLTDMVSDGIIKRTGLGRYVLTGKPLKNAELDRNEATDPKIKRIHRPIRYRSIGAALFGDPPIGRSFLDIGRGRPLSTHVALD